MPEERDARGELHQLIPAEVDLKGKAAKLIAEAITLFTKKREHFDGRVTFFTMNKAARSAEERQEIKVMDTTVLDKLKYVASGIIPYYDAFFQKERTDQEASADVEVDGAVLLKDMPVTALLGLETRLSTLRHMFAAIPTLEPGKDWKKNANGVWEDANPDVKNTTEKDFKFRILYEAKDKHPAQIEKWQQDVVIGKKTTHLTSGRLTSKELSELLSRTDALIIEVKKARCRANTAKVVSGKIGETIFSYLLHDLK